MHHLTRTLFLLLGIILLAFAGTALADHSEEPSIRSESAQNVTATGADLHAQVNPHGNSTTFVFQYGTTTAYGSETPSAAVGGSNSWQPVHATVNGLQAATTYHYRVVATNSHGTTYGADQSFTTSPAQAAADQDSGGGDGSGGNTSSGPGSDAPPQKGAQAPSTDAEQAPSTDAEQGKTVAVEPTKGTVRVRRPGSSSFLELSDDAELPAGSEVDARKGAIALTSVLPSGETQTGVFGGGRFVIRHGRRGYVDLHLRGRVCPRRGGGSSSEGAAVAAAAKRPSAGRRLWGRDKGGRFRTHGKNSHATVRGTRWLVVDRCDGTLTRVTEGAVVVRDLVRGTRKLVKAGESYLAPKRR